MSVKPVTEVVAREPELAAVDALLERSNHGLAVLHFRGPAGIGKTTIWSAGLAQARAAGLTVLEARPVETEAQLSYVAVGDLLHEIADVALDELAPPQQRALRVTLKREAAPAGGLDPLTVAVAATAALGAVARTGPLILAVDDVQWLDSASAEVLVYALRRLVDAPVHVLLTERAEPSDPAPLGLDRPPVTERTTSLVVGGLSLAALQRLLHERAGVSLSRPDLRLVHERSEGNPFHALELARAVAAGGSAEANGLVPRRLAALPPATREILLHAALLSAPELEVLERITPTAHDALRPAVDADLVRIARGRVHFSHPLYASGVLDAAGGVEQRAAHARLAALLPPGEARAQHLARATTSPDGSVAAEVTAAAHEATRRGATSAAARLMDEAVRLTPDHAAHDACQRAIEAGFLWFLAGDAPRADAQLRDVAAAAPTVALRARALSRLGRAHHSHGRRRAAEAILREGLALHDLDPAVNAELREGVSWAMLLQRGDIPTTVAMARLALEDAEALGDPVQLGDSLSVCMQAEFMLGNGIAEDLVERALAAVDSDGDRWVLRDPRMHHGLLLLCSDDLEGARERYTVIEALAHTRGDDSALPFVALRLSQVELMAGELAAAHARALEGAELSEQVGQGPLSAALWGTVAVIAAHRGHLGEARDAAAEGLARAQRLDDGVGLRMSTWALGHVALIEGDPEGAAAHLEPMWATSRAHHLLEPGENRYLGDLLEALVALGRSASATELVEWLEEAGARLDRPSVRALALRGRGLLAADAGALDDAIAALQAAQAEPVALPLEVARTRLVLGRTLRRARRRKEAREVLTEALEAFGAVGAEALAELARAELARIGGRAPSDGGLTPAELAVAELVAAGRTNRETAAALVVTEKTVEHHLSHIYAKLGVRSRAELAAHFRTSSDPG